MRLAHPADCISAASLPQEQEGCRNETKKLSSTQAYTYSEGAFFSRCPAPCFGSTGSELHEENEQRGFCPAACTAASSLLGDVKIRRPPLHAPPMHRSVLPASGKDKQQGSTDSCTYDHRHLVEVIMRHYWKNGGRRHKTAGEWVCVKQH